MGNWVKRVLGPADGQDSPDHVAAEDMARLADGAVDESERDGLIRHINRCRRCYDILRHSIDDNPFEMERNSGSTAGWKSRGIYALAASIILVLIISGMFVYRHWTRDAGIVSATLELDQQLIDILMEDSALQIAQSPRLDRLLGILQQRGIPVEKILLAVLSKPYYQKKDLFGPKEYLHIRIEDHVVYLEVEERK